MSDYFYSLSMLLSKNRKPHEYLSNLDVIIYFLEDENNQ